MKRSTAKYRVAQEEWPLGTGPCLLVINSRCPGVARAPSMCFLSETLVGPGNQTVFEADLHTCRGIVQMYRTVGSHCFVLNDRGEQVE